MASQLASVSLEQVSAVVLANREAVKALQDVLNKALASLKSSEDLEKVMIQNKSQEIVFKELEDRTKFQRISPEMSSMIAMQVTKGVNPLKVAEYFGVAKGTVYNHVNRDSKRKARGGTGIAPPKKLGRKSIFHDTENIVKCLTWLDQDPSISLQNMAQKFRDEGINVAASSIQR